jgi:hypothetical protein
MLCDRCTYIFQDLETLPARSEKIPHHADSASFKAAIMAGCFTCMALASEIDDAVTKLDDPATASRTYWKPLKFGIPRFGMFWVAARDGVKRSGVREIYLVPSKGPWSDISPSRRVFLYRFPGL